MLLLSLLLLSPYIAIILTACLFTVSQFRVIYSDD